MFALLFSCLGKPLILMHVYLVSLMLRKTSFSFMFVLSYPVLRQTFCHACLPCQSHAQANPFMHACLVRPSAQTNHFSCMFVLSVSCLDIPLHACWPCQSHTQANFSCMFVLLVSCLGKHLFLQVLIPQTQAKPYNSALVNHHLLVNSTPPVSDIPLYGFKRHTLGPNNTLTTTSPFPKSFPIQLQTLFKSNNSFS